MRLVQKIEGRAAIKAGRLAGRVVGERFAEGGSRKFIVCDLGNDGRDLVDVEVPCCIERIAVGDLVELEGPK